MDIGGWINAFFTEPGPGGFFVLLVIGLAGTIYALLIRWILRGGEGEQPPARRLQGTYRKLSSEK